MDIVFITDLRVETIIGIYDWERQVKQVVAFDLEMAHDNRRPAVTDAIEDALNYKAVAKCVIAFVEGSQFLLVERLAESVAELIMREFKVPWLKLTLHKPGALRQARDVGVVIERGQRPHG